MEGQLFVGVEQKRAGVPVRADFFIRREYRVS